MIHTFIDTETTGLDPSLHHIHQISGIIFDDSWKELERFDLKFCPKTLEGHTAEALQVSNITPGELAARPMTYIHAHGEFCKIMSKYVDKYDRKDKALLYGYNVSFDERFVRAWFSSCGDEYFGSWFWFPFIDVMQVAAHMVGKDRPSFPNFKLGTVCKAAGIEFADIFSHDGFYDVLKTAELYRFFCKN